MMTRNNFFIIFAMPSKGSKLIMEEQQGKRQIIADYYTAHFDELLGFVHKQVKNADDAEDIVQNVFLRLLNSDKMISVITLPCLVYTVARNLIFDHWRRHRIFDEYEHYLQSSINDDAIDVASVFSVTEITEILERGIARLTDNQRQVYRMNFFDDLPVSTISKTLNLNYKSVEHRLGSARKEVRRYVERMLA